VISSSGIHFQVVRIIGGCNGEEAKFVGGALQWSLGVRFSREEDREDCQYLGEFGSWLSFLLCSVTFALPGPTQSQHWELTW